MIVVCEHCQTRFRLDDARIPARGARVRCSRCKTSFFVSSPSASEGEALEDVARTAAEQGATPEPAGDLSDPTLVVPSGSGGGSDEQWEFDDDAVRPPPATLHDEEPSLGEPDTVIGEDSDLENLGDEALEAALADSEAARAQLAFDGEGIGLGDAQEGDPAAAEPTRPRSREAAPVREEAASPEAGDDFDLDGLGNPDEWSFVPDGPRAEAAPPPAHEIHDDDPFGLDEAEEGTSRPAAAERSGASPGASSATPRPRRRTWLASAPAAVGWLASSSLALLGVALAARPRPVAQPAPAAAESRQLTGGAATDVRGRFLENALGGRTFVVSGALTTTQGPVLLRVEWLDADGRALHPGAVAGPALPEAQLRERAPEALRDELAAAAGQLEWGGRFDAVMPDPPKGATSFGLQLEPAPPPPSPADAGAEGADSAAPGPASAGADPAGPPGAGTPPGAGPKAR